MEEHEDEMRDAFATAALIGLLASPNTDLTNQIEVCSDAYSLADRMIAERAKRVRKQ